MYKNPATLAFLLSEVIPAPPIKRGPIKKREPRDCCGRVLHLLILVNRRLQSKRRAATVNECNGGFSPIVGVLCAKLTIFLYADCRIIRNHGSEEAHSRPV